MSTNLTKSNGRLRASRPKVRTGCITCKIRHVKCDEQKPACLRCLDTGRVCDGYPIKGDFHALQPLGVIRANFSSLARVPNVGMFGTDQERRSFEFFRCQTARALDLALESTSWDRLVLQTSHAHAAVRHAIVALGAISERFSINSVATAEDVHANACHDFANLQYHKAIGQLRNLINNGTENIVELTLMTCFLFICFEFFQGNDIGALLHLRNGLKIIQHTYVKELRCPPDYVSVWRSTSPNYVRKDILYVYSCCDLQASWWLGLDVYLSQGLRLTEGFPPISDIPERFDDLEQAELALNSLMDRLSHFRRVAATYRNTTSLDEISLDVMEARQYMVVQLDNWQHALDSCVTQRWIELDSDGSHRITVMNIGHKISSMILNTIFDPVRDTNYHKFDPVFEQIVCHASTLLRPINVIAKGLTGTVSRINRPPDPPNDPLPLFSFPNGIIQSLYFTAVKCGNRSTCRKAISLLSSSPWREGAWDSAAMSKIAERKCQQFETQGLYRDSSSDKLQDAAML